MKPVRLITPLARQLVFIHAKHKFSPLFAMCQRYQHGSAQATEESEVMASGKVELRRPCVTKWKRPPFVKNLFIGKFDTNVLPFPEVLDKERVEELELWVKNIRSVFQEKVNSSLIEMNQKIPEDILQSLKDLGFFGRMVPKEYGGLGLTRTEYLRLNEIVGLDCSIGASLLAHECLATEAILRFGDERQKKEYLPDLASGKKVAAVAYYEIASGSDFRNLQTEASFIPENKCYAINGTKSWVTNAEAADFFIVFAKEFGTKFVEDDTETLITAFLVEKDTEGLEVRKCDNLVGLKGSDAGELRLHSVVVPEKNILGQSKIGRMMIAKLIECSRFGIGSLTFSSLKCLYDVVADYVIDAERLGKSLSSFQAMRKRLSNVIRMLYAMESVAYFTAALYDTTDKPDFLLEDSIMKIFNTEGALFCVQELIAALGAVGLSNQYMDVQRFYRDAQTLMYSDYNNDISRLLIGLTACQYAGNNHGDVILKHRNPTFYPWDTIKKQWKHWQVSKERFRYDQDIAGHLHPSLICCGNNLEECVQRLQLAVDRVLEYHGRNILEAQFSPMRLADLAINIYARTAVLSRINRSYCIGLTNTHEEKIIAINFCEDANKRFMKTFLEIVQDEIIVDEQHLIIGQHVVDKRGYFPEHPLKHNF